MVPLVVTLLRISFLVFLWILVLIIVMSMRRDLGVGKRARIQPAGAPAGPSGSSGPGAGMPSQPSQAPRNIAHALVVVEGPGAGTSVRLAASPILLGRAQEASLVLMDDYASSRHARLFPQGTRWFLEDLGSTNGTYVDEVQLTRAQPIEVGQRIRIGKTVMELRP
ncbi:FHA domain-containing protein [Arthrobacter sp. HMSC06H05]|uniref:PSer/pThr/pTyr-binding forkhead associated (FHA) protein n=1 Tax=Pseudoglutamicibacter albus TaxID=98671 RepID=A0ABU1Z1W4_9MICC|nr:MULTISPECIES: FHA domain-containing protein [Micrococcaceae]MDR7294568.1 pSer/pThr/pTyr-binding forkhead associated (FHA) protein [Pseudoglutamicibacter albus]OFT42229.1 FHA domain-containing protein [Arthrobacter sp. HMSC06H05]